MDLSAALLGRQRPDQATEPTETVAEPAKATGWKKAADAPAKPAKARKAKKATDAAPTA